MNDISPIVLHIAALVGIPGFLWLVGRGFHAYIGARRPHEWSIGMPTLFKTWLATSRAERLYVGPLLVQAFALLYLLLGILVLIYDPSCFEAFSAWCARLLLLVVLVAQFLRIRPSRAPASPAAQPSDSVHRT